MLVILGETLDRARGYAELLHTPFPVLADPDRDIYKQYGLEKTLLIIQRSASIILDRNGVIRYIKRVTNPMTWLGESQGLLDILKNLEIDPEADVNSPDH